MSDTTVIPRSVATSGLGYGVRHNALSGLVAYSPFTPPPPGPPPYGAPFSKLRRTRLPLPIVFLDPFLQQALEEDELLMIAAALAASAGLLN